MSRVVDRRFIFGKAEKHEFRTLMRRLAAFSGVEVLTYTILSNHFHLLLRVPKPIQLTDAELLKRLCSLYGNRGGRQRMDEILDLDRRGQPEVADHLRSGYIARMYELSCYVKELKQRFTQSYNRRKKRKGTLWEERFKSVLVDGKGHPLVTIAAYIDLNAVRAGLCKDPAMFAFCGYGEAVAGVRTAQAGIRAIIDSEMPGATWLEAAQSYWSFLMSPEAVLEDLSPTHPAICPEHLHVHQLLRLRIRYFSDGMVLGSRAFVEDTCGRLPGRTCPRRPRLHQGDHQGQGSRGEEGADHHRPGGDVGISTELFGHDIGCHGGRTGAEDHGHQRLFGPQV